MQNKSLYDLSVTGLMTVCCIVMYFTTNIFIIYSFYMTNTILLKEYAHVLSFILLFFYVSDLKVLNEVL